MADETTYRARHIAGDVRQMGEPTHDDGRKAGETTRGIGRFGYALFIVIALVMMAIPSLGMIWFPTETTSTTTTEAEPPTLRDEDGKLNVNVLADAGAYFEEHFALRNEMITAYAHMLTPLETSVTDQVVVGSDGWLFYGLTLPDYLGQSALSDRALSNIAHNLALMQGYAESQGARFVFAVAPNKNTLYPEHMPARYVRSEEPGNWERLKPLLDEAGVSYVDLFDLFEER